MRRGTCLWALKPPPLLPQWFILTNYLKAFRLFNYLYWWDRENPNFKILEGWFLILDKTAIQGQIVGLFTLLEL